MKTRPRPLARYVAAMILAAGCSHAAPEPSSNATTLSTNEVTGLSQVAQLATPSVPTDTATARLAAQLADLEQDRTVRLGAAAALLADEGDPANSEYSSRLEEYRQLELSAASSDLTQINSLKSGMSVPGKGTLATDGGAVSVLSSVVEQSLAAQAAAYLAQGKNAAQSAAPGPSSAEIATFLQGAAIVLADDGPGGHEVANHIISRQLLRDASVEELIAPADGGVSSLTNGGSQ